jgi:hypothetical protein
MDASEAALSELEQNIKIDPDELEIELIKQPNDYYHASAGFAMAISLRDQAKNELDIAEAELFLAFRDEVIARTERPTEALLEAMINASDIHRSYVDKHLETKLLADKWLALRDSFIQKGHALRELANLHKLNYFGERPVTNADRGEAEAQVRKRATDHDR